MSRDEGLTPGDSTQGENAIAAVARRMADCIERLPDDVVASFESTDAAERVSRLKRITNEILLGMAPVVNWSERRRAADTAALLKDRLYYALEEAITCSSCNIPEYSGGAICKTNDQASDGAGRTATLMVFAKLMANSLRGWADDIEFEDTQRSAAAGDREDNAAMPESNTAEEEGDNPPDEEYIFAWDGDGFYIGFHSYLESRGFGKREDIPCTCSDDGAHGHQPECRWVKS